MFLLSLKSRAIAIFIPSFCLIFLSFSVFAKQQGNQANVLQNKLNMLETSSAGRLGVYVVNTQNKKVFGYHAQELFPFCSTSKVMVVGGILKKSMTNKQLLQEKIKYTRSDLAAYSPITEQHIAEGMTVSELCSAAIMYSDNTAMNLLINKLGGPSAVTAFARSIGDTSFRLDRLEPDLNTAIPGDLKDTTTPEAMARSLELLVLNHALAASQQEQLQTWLKGNTTGNLRIRAGVPTSWIVGDKTGTGDYGTTNDIAILWPPKSLPIVLVIYFTQKSKNAAPNDEVIAAATRIIVESIN